MSSQRSISGTHQDADDQDESTDDGGHDVPLVHRCQGRLEKEDFSELVSFFQLTVL